MKKLINFCFLYPLTASALNFQGWVSMFLSQSYGQALAYGNLLFICLGFVLLIKKQEKTTRTGSLWLPYFGLFYIFVCIASIVNYDNFALLASLVPVIYCIGFLSFLRFQDHIRNFEIVLTVAFAIANTLLIYFVLINFDIDFYQKGIKIDYGLDRAQGIYGDANNAAFVAILGFIFTHKCFVPQNKFQLVLKLIILSISAYALFLTYSTTGFGVFMIAFALLNLKYLNKTRLAILPFFLVGFYMLLINMSLLLEGFNLNKQQQNKIDNFVNILKLDFDNVDSSGRDLYVQELFNYIAENPIMGNGLDFGAHHHGHNTYLSIIADAGIFPLLLFIFLLIRYIKNSFLIDKTNRYYALAILQGFILFMLSLQTVINQAYLLAIFIYLAYYIDNHSGTKLNIA